MTIAAVIERLNIWGNQFSGLAWPLFWQSSTLIAGMFVLDFLFRRKLRPAVRHALWLVVLVKLVLPPSFAFPTGISWWLRPREIASNKAPSVSYVVTYGPTHATVPIPEVRRTPVPPPAIRLSIGAWELMGTCMASFFLLVVMLRRWRRIHNELRNQQPAPIWLEEIVRSACQQARHRRPVRLMLTSASLSPALYGLFRPIIVLPAALLERLTALQLRTVVLHELIHLRNGDVWINCAQSLLQIVFWWHPLLWLANARIRRIREEVVDDAVRLRLGDQAESYAPTLLEVARLALARPLATLGLVGILESRQALRQRVERMVSSPVPKRTGLTVVSVIGVLAFSSIAVPMGQAPPKPVKSSKNYSSPIYYSFDQTFRDYFGSNGVEAITRQLDQFGNDSDPSLSSGIFTQLPPAAESFDLAGSLSSCEGRLSGSPEGTNGPTWLLQPLNENGWSDFDVRSRVATAENGAKLTYGNTTITADSITVNQGSGELLAEGSVKLEGPAMLPLGGKFHGNITNLQFAQNQPTVRPTAARQASATGRKAILNKLQAITFNNVSFDNLPLSEVVNYLQNEAKKRDPEGKGINFILNANADMPAPAIDSATGLLTSPTPPEPVDINGVTIRILPALNDVRLIDVLDAVVKVANARIRYSIEDYGVSFRTGGAPMPLFSRTIRIDPNTFAQGLESVSGVSVGNLQTGQAGGGQQGNGITFPRVQAAPNGAGGQGGQGSAQGSVGGGISGVTRPTTAITPQAIRQFFANAGVDLTPPKSIYYNYGSSSLMVHASKEDLDTIENAIKTMPSGAAQPATASREQIARGSMATERNEKKVPVLGDVPIPGKVFTRTVEVASAVSPASLPERVTQNSNAKLLTRVMKVNPGVFLESIKKTAVLPENANSQDTIGAFRKMVMDSGVELSPPKNIFFNEHGGTLLVRATAEEMDVIEEFVQEFNVAPPQVNIRVEFVEATDEGTRLLFGEIGAEFLISAQNTTVITESQFKAVWQMMKQREGFDLLAEQNVTTLSGRPAQVQNAEVQSVVTLNPQALVLPGVVSSNLFTVEPVSFGPTLDVTPLVAENGLTISLTTVATVTAFLGNNSVPAGEAPVYVDGKSISITPPLPRIRVRQIQTTKKIGDGQTLVLSRIPDVIIKYEKTGKAVTEPNKGKKELFVFITATLIDPAGNRINNNENIPSTEHN